MGFFDILYGNGLRHRVTNIEFSDIYIAQTGKNTDLAVSLLREGKLVAIPTETVYGLAANALDEIAVLSIFKTKERPHFDPLIVHIHDIDQVEKYANWSDDRLKQLAQHFWPGPLTLLLNKKVIIPDLVTSGLDQVAIRVPSHPLTLEVLRKIELPLAAPSANPFGYVSPTSATHVQKQLGNKIDYILDGGECKVGLESTIVGIEDDKLCIYRLGGLSLEEIEKVAGKVDLRLNSSSDPKAPGQLKSHYAPLKKLYVGDIAELMKLHSGKRIALIGFGEIKEKGDLNFNLSIHSDTEEAARNLFRILREADESDAEIVIATVIPEQGLGKAVNDRLKRAGA